MSSFPAEPEHVDFSCSTRHPSDHGGVQEAVVAAAPVPRLAIGRSQREDE
jgi:hypothetical protein